MYIYIYIEREREREREIIMSHHVGSYITLYTFFIHVIITCQVGRVGTGVSLWPRCRRHSPPRAPPKRPGFERAGVL